MGSIYKRGNTYWIKYYRNGKSYRESTNSDKKMVAKKLLDRREGEIAQGKTPGIVFENVLFEVLAECFLRDYVINEKKSIPRAKRCVAVLSDFFSGMKVPQITTLTINVYIEKRLNTGSAHATINRELSALKRMFNIVRNQTPPLVDRVPYIPMLKENNARKGFFEHDEFIALREAMPEHLKGFITFGYKVGWRISEIAKLTWSQVDRKIWAVRLEVGETKNNKGRTIYLDEELKAIFNNQWELRKSNQALIPYVFTNKDGTDRIKRFDKAWTNACKVSGIGVRIFHDFRRTSVRNMVRAGIPERVSMEISGHKTRSVFDRYNIVNEADLKMAAHKQEKYLNSITGTISGTISYFEPKKLGSK